MKILYFLLSINNIIIYKSLDGRNNKIIIFKFKSRESHENHE